MAVRTWKGEGDSALPNDWNTPANWLEGFVPVNGDDVYFSDNAVSVLTGLDQSAVMLASLNFRQSFTGVNAPDASSFLQIGTQRLTIGQNQGNSSAGGSSRLNIDLQPPDSGGTQIDIYQTNTSPADQNRQTVRIIGGKDSASGILNVFIRSGVVSFAEDGGSTFECDDIHITEDDADVKLGDSVTYQNLFMRRGSFEGYSMPAVEARFSGGDGILQGVDALPLLVMDGTASVISNIEGTISQVDGYGGTVDFSQSDVSRILTLLNLKEQNFSMVYDKDVLDVQSIVNQIEGFATLGVS